jgi:hypothetical protein
METTTASIAAMNAISTYGSAEGVMPMDKEFYTRLEGYRSSMVQAKHMLFKGLVSADEYAIIDTMMAKKYGLPSCSLFRDNDLLSILRNHFIPHEHTSRFLNYECIIVQLHGGAVLSKLKKSL